MAPESETSIPNNDVSQPGPETVDFHLQKALDTSLTTSHPVSLFSLPPPPSSPPNTTVSHPTLPQITPLSPTTLNNIFLYPGSYNPPHAGHLATIRYFHTHRALFHTTTLFIFADPPSTVSARHKLHNRLILPQDFRYTLFASEPFIASLITSGWLKILVGDMQGHISVLKEMTDGIAREGCGCAGGVRLVGFLGGDKLSKESMLHERPGELVEWGPVDEFLIMNARRHVDFYTPAPAPVLDDIPGCIRWGRGPIDTDTEAKIGKLWSCRALTVPGKPVIRFRASESIASNGISSTIIRRVMNEAKDEELLDELREMVLSPELLAEWLKKEREGEKESEKAFL
ncbi:hypothetical protein DL95DRAFT_485253 [Leptodontidium sp. 2 PMI_412]|nr:hypothetical protein DL95DRAFT_485253 [Leptodontidium sp. 2 PMI_412]